MVHHEIGSPHTAQQTVLFFAPKQCKVNWTPTLFARFDTVGFLINSKKNTGRRFPSADKIDDASTQFFDKTNYCKHLSCRKP